MMVPRLLLVVSASFIFTLVHTAVSTDWKLTCYGEQLQIACDLSKIVVLHNAQFGFFKQIIGRKNLNVSCIAQQRGDCWIDVTPSMSRLCSGYSSCTTNVQYSLELPLDAIARECSIEAAGFSKPSLFVEYSCVSTTLFTRLTSNSHVDSEQVGGYLATLDYAETRNGGTEWRMHQADAICRVGEEQLPYRFYLPAPNTQPHQPSFGLEEMVAFVLRIKDMSLTQPTTHSGTAENGKAKLRLATDQECFNLGQPCQQDYLEISAKLPSRHYSDASFDVIPVTRLCLTESATQSETPVKDSEATMIGRTFGPLPSAVGLQFRSNLNLRDSQVIPGKGILIEYIALFCTPIRNPTGYGIVDYRFLTLPHSSHTVAYAEIFCPSDRWLEPQRPTETEAIHRNQTVIPWWLERIQHTTRACNHHSRSWSDRIPEACLTEAELDVFVAKVKMDMEQASTTKINSSDIALSTSEMETNYSVGNMTIEVPSPPLGRTAVSEVLSGPVIKAGSSEKLVAVGVVLGFLICLMAVVLIIYSLRHRLFAQYHKNETYPSFPDRMTRSASTFNQSTHSYYPTISSMDWRRKWNKSKWDLFKPWRVPPWSQNLSGTYPDLPRQTIVHGSSLGISRTPDTVVVDRFHPTWRTQLPRSLASSFSLNPGYPHPMAFENGEAANMSPWLRTNSTTRLARKPHFFASSSELVSPIDGQPQFSRSWWLPWRRSFRKQRRLYTQLLRRREAQYQSQRRLMPSNGISNSSSMHFGHLPSTPGGMFGSQSLMNSKIHLENNKLPAGEREAAEGAVSQLTTQSTRTLINNEQVSANGISPRSDELTSLYPVLKNKLHYNYTNVDPINGYPSLYCQPITHQPYQPATADQVQNGTTANEPLPWKSTPPGNSLSQGFRRLSSFLRNLNGSLTPPRGSTRNAQQQQLAGQFYPQSMSGLNAAHYFQTGMNDPMFRRLSGPQPIPQGISARSRSESGSARFGLGMRSLYQISLSRGADPIASMYNLDVDDASAFGDPLSGSTTTVTKTTRLGSTAAVSPGCGPDYWDQYPSVDVGGHRVSTASTIRPPTPIHCSQQQLMQQGLTAGHSAQSQLSQMINMSHSNDPYLVPASVKRRQVAQTTGDAHKMKYLSETERLPSGTSSAVSSLVFGDSAEEDQEVGDLISQPPPPPPPPLLPTMAAGAGVPCSPSGRPLTLSEQVASGSPQGWTRFPIEYVTYDETHSCANTLIKPPGDEDHMQQDLIATQIGVPPNQQSSVKRRCHEDKGDENSRPLSDAMISNHYYTGTDIDMSIRGPMEQAPPRLPPRVNPPTEIAVSERSLSPKPNLPLPPLWNRPSQNGTPNKPEPPRLTTRDEYGSVDSLYETVDQYKPTEIRATSEQQINDQRMTNLVTVGQESQLQRQKLALPPTPDSLESLRAPVASSDDDTGDEGEKPEKKAS